MSGLPESLAFIDLETTGADPARDRITEIGIVTVEGGQISRWSTLVNPGQTIPPFIQRMTGIDDDMVAGAPPFEAVACELRERLSGRLFVAHNARFDYGFVRHEFRRLGQHFQSEVLCTVKLSRKLYPEHPKHGLDSLIPRHGLVVAGRHRALADADLIWQFWQVLRREQDDARLAMAIGHQLKRADLPPHLTRDSLDDLPEYPGVFRFYGADDALLYIGKSASLRQRVLAHFTPGTREARAVPVRDTIRRFDWIETAGEFGAALIEARLLRQTRPPHNHARPGAGETLCAWRLEAVAPGDYRPRLLEGREAEPARGMERYGLYQGRREALAALGKLAEAHRLCPRWLGLDAAGATTSCRIAGESVCRGVCAGHEPVGTGSARLMGALARTRQEAWPFPGPVAIVERNDFLEREEWQVFDDWRHLGMARNEADALDLCSGGADFDLEIHKLLKAALSKGRLRIRNLG